MTATVMATPGDRVAEVAAEEAVAVFGFNAGGEGGTNLGDCFAVRFVDDGAASDIDPAVNCALASRQAREAALGLFAGLSQRQRFASLIEVDEPTHGERQRRRRERAPFLAPEAPIVNVVGKRRRDALRRVEQRNDGAAPWIAADRFPGGEVIDENHEETDAAENPLAVVEQLVPQQRALAGRLDGGRRQFGDDGQAFARRQRTGGGDR